MSWNQRPRTEEPQIDPFNAPDPIMPSGDQVMDSGDVEPSEERAPRGAGRPRSFDRPHKRRQRPKSDSSSTRHRSTKSDDGYRAPTELPDAYEAPSTDGTPGTVAAERARASIKLARQAAREAKRAQQGARGGKRNKGCITIIVVLFLFSGGVGLLEAACSATVDTIDQAFFTDQYSVSYSYDYSDDAGDDDTYGNGLTYSEIEQLEDDITQDAQDQTQADLEALVADADGTLVKRIGDDFAESFDSYCGTSAENAGVDSYEVARWILDTMTFEITDAYSYLDSYDGLSATATVYFDATVPNAGDIAYYVSSFIFSEYSDIYRTDMVFDDDQRAQIAQALEDAKERALDEAESRDYFLQDYVADASTSPATLTRDSEDWEGNIQSLFRLW